MSKLFSDEVLNLFFVCCFQRKKLRWSRWQGMDYDFRHEFCFIVFYVKEINFVYIKLPLIDLGLVGDAREDDEF